VTSNPQPRPLADLVGMLDDPEGEATLRLFYRESPVLIVRDGDEGGDPALIATSVEGFRTRRYSRMEEDKTSKWLKGKLEPLGEEGVVSGGEVISVSKTDRNPFVGVITVGRAKNNDIILAAASVSKLQAFIKQDLGDGTWSVEDRNSTNHTTVNTVELKANTVYPLAIGDEIIFGEVRCLFTDAEGLILVCGSK
jgi:hypothetical protein